MGSMYIGKVMRIVQGLLLNLVHGLLGVVTAKERVNGILGLKGI